MDIPHFDALRTQWKKGVKSVSLVYGVHGWKEWGPKLQLMKAWDGDMLDPPPEILALWDELVVYMKSNGVKHLYYADISIDKKSATAREGQGIQLRYDR